MTELHADLFSRHACPLEKELFFVVAINETSGSGQVTLKIYRQKSSAALASLDGLLASQSTVFESKDISSTPSAHPDSSS